MHQESAELKGFINFGLQTFESMLDMVEISTVVSEAAGSAPISEQLYGAVGQFGLGTGGRTQHRGEHPSTEGDELHSWPIVRRNRSKRINTKVRSLKIEAVDDFAARKIMPWIRLSGNWMKSVGFNPGYRMEINVSKHGELTIRL